MLDVPSMEGLGAALARYDAGDAEAIDPTNRLVRIASIVAVGMPSIACGRVLDSPRAGRRRLHIA